MHKFPVLESDAASASQITSTPLSVTFPSSPSDVSAGPVISAPPASAALGERLPPILVADDDPDDTFFIERLIKKTGVRNPVRTFDDGTEVVNFLGGSRLATPAGREHCPRLLFLDLKMRRLGGFGFLEWARQQKE